MKTVGRWFRRRFARPRGVHRMTIDTPIRHTAEHIIQCCHTERPWDAFVGYENPLFADTGVIQLGPFAVGTVYASTLD